VRSSIEKISSGAEPSSVCRVAPANNEKSTGGAIMASLLYVFTLGSIAAAMFVALEYL
jgi:hypothetical protein